MTPADGTGPGGLDAVAARLRAAGKPFKVDAVAVMRERLALLNASVETGTPWTDKLVEGD